MSGAMRPLFVLLTALATLGGPPGTREGNVTGRVRCPSLRDCAGAVVYIPKIEGRQYERSEAIIDQANLTFVPHTLVVVAGSRVAFPNSDDLRHNVFSASAAKRFNLGMYPRGVTKYLVFDRPGVVELLCNVHPEMSAYVIVSETPFSAVVGADGRFVLARVPEGRHSVIAWHERLPARAADVTVRGGQEASAEFVLIPQN